MIRGGSMLLPIATAAEMWRGGAWLAARVATTLPLNRKKSILYQTFLSS
jgi:hypothetical protein